jgi:hypothetical protein
MNKIDFLDLLASRSRLDASGCRLWTGRTSGGYGRLTVAGKPIRAHRLAFELARGPIAADLCVCHHCDTPTCINTDHMFLGTHADNMADMRKKGRGRAGGSTKNAGTANGSAKLNDEAVRRIRSDMRPLRVLAAEYGVAVGVLSNVRTGKTWRHV